MITKSDIKLTGNVDIIVDYLDQRQEILEYQNTVLYSGRRAMAKSLANLYGDTFQFNITKMIFGDGGTMNGVKRYVDGGRTGLFGVTRLAKPVISTMTTDKIAQVIFTSIIRFEDINGMTINEMGLEMSNGELYSMLTFPDLTKTPEMQLTFNWHLNFI